MLYMIKTKKKIFLTEPKSNSASIRNKKVDGLKENEMWYKNFEYTIR